MSAETLTATRLLPALTEYCRLTHQSLPLENDEHKLPMTVIPWTTTRRT